MTTSQIFFTAWVLFTSGAASAYLLGVRSGRQSVHREFARAQDRRQEWQQPHRPRPIPASGKRPYDWENGR